MRFFGFPSRRTLAVAAATSSLATTLAAGVAFGQPAGPPPPPTEAPPPPELAPLRARYQGMTAQEAQAAGFEPTPCVSAAEAGLPPSLGAMGQHFMNGPLYQQQFANGMDPANPPALLVDANGLVVGVEWEANQAMQPAPTLFGIAIPVQPPHPGVPDPHYMLHAYFRPAGMAMLSPPNAIPFDPQLSCTPTPPAGDGRTLAGETRATRELFVGTWGAQAAAVWAKEHSAAVRS